MVAFDTPLEALQAISMFHGQTLFDRNMSVKMDKLANIEEKKPSLPGMLAIKDIECYDDDFGSNPYEQYVEQDENIN